MYFSSVVSHVSGKPIGLCRFSDDSTIRRCNNYGFDRCNCTIEGYDSGLQYNVTIIGRNDFGESQSTISFPAGDTRPKIPSSDGKIRSTTPFPGEKVTLIVGLRHTPMPYYISVDLLVNPQIPNLWNLYWFFFFTTQILHTHISISQMIVNSLRPWDAYMRQ